MEKMWKEIQPMLTVCVGLAGVIVWCYTTFAQLSLVKEQNTQMLAQIDRLRIETTARQEQDKRDMQLYSDRNREKMEAIMSAVRDEIRAMREDLKNIYRGHR